MTPLPDPAHAGRAPGSASCAQMIYNVTEPPEGARCSERGCCSVADVRVIIPESRFTADGIDHSKAPSTFDACEWHWPAMRDACMRNGHRIVDTTGEIGELVADFPQCNVFSSDSGRLYASSRTNGSVPRATVDAWLVGQLRAQLERASAYYG